LQPLKNSRFVIPKSRYDSVDSYLSPCGELYNDIELIYDKAVYDQLIAAGKKITNYWSSLCRTLALQFQSVDVGLLFTASYSATISYCSNMITAFITCNSLYI